MKIIMNVYLYKDTWTTSAPNEIINHWNALSEDDKKYYPFDLLMNGVKYNTFYDTAINYKDNFQISMINVSQERKDPFMTYITFEGKIIFCIAPNVYIDGDLDIIMKT